MVVQAAPSRKLGAAFVRAPGRHIPRSEWTADFLKAYGALLGRLHEHARRWRPGAAPQRPSWLAPAYAHRAAEVRPDDQALVEAVAEALAGLAIVPSGADEVGIVHGDLHTGNVLVADDGTITAIDFDDAVVGPYLYDLAIPIFYAVAGRDGDAASRTTSFLEPFLAGFDRQAPRPDGGAAAVAACLAARQADLAVALYDGVADGRMAPAHLEYAERLRDAVMARTVPAPYEVLKRFFGD